MLPTHALPQIYTKFLNKKVKIKNTANNLPPASSYAHRQEIIYPKLFISLYSKNMSHCDSFFE